MPFKETKLNLKMYHTQGHERLNIILGKNKQLTAVMKLYFFQKNIYIEINRKMNVAYICAKFQRD